MAEHSVLVVDDEPGIRQMLTLILQAEGYTVLTATNGAEALRLLEQHLPACLLLDMRMPVMNGWQLAQALQARDLAIPLIVMTAAVDARRWASEVGATAFLAKPFDLAELLSLVEQVVQRNAGGPTLGVADLAS